MNAPQRDQRSVDDDPTGMRALLRGLPEPGPMPADLVVRIQSSLAAQPRVDPSVLDLGDYRAHRAARKGLWIAAAASLLAVAGGGVAASGGPDAMVATITGGSSSASVASAATERSAAGPQIPSSSDLSSVAGLAPTGTVRVVMTDGAWTGIDLTPALEAALATQTDVQPLAAESPTLGPIATPIGGRDCATALGIPADTGVVVALGTHDGEPAALVLATPTRGELTAYLVGRNCRTGNSELRVGPQTHRL